MTQHNKFPHMTRLARTFPMFALPHGAKCKHVGIEPFDATKLAEWAGVCSSGELHAIRFLLTVYSGEANIDEYELGRFDFVRAIGTWDDQYRKAFTDWCSAPFWP